MDSTTARIVLDLPETGSLGDDEIQEAFREKSKEYHPDTSDLANAREKFLKVKKAREVLLAANTSQSSGTQSSPSQTESTQRNETARNPTGNSNSSSDSHSNQDSTETSQANHWRKTSEWTTNRDTSSNWRDNKASSTTRNEEAESREEEHQKQGSTTTTETNTTGGADGDRTSRHQQAWENNANWDPNYGFNGGGYLGVGEFPDRPPSRSRIIHLLAIIVGCIATALLSRGQYNALKESSAASKVIEPALSIRLAFGIPSLLAVAGTFRKVQILWRFFSLPRVFLAVIGGSAVPVIVHSTVTGLSLPEAAGVAAIGSGSMMGILALSRRTEEEQEIPTVDEWLNVTPSITWLPGGVFTLLALHTPVYLASQSFGGLYYESFKLYFILIGPAVGLAFLISCTRLMRREEITPGTTLASMMIIGAIIHLPVIEPIIPVRLLGGGGYYTASTGVLFSGILTTILAVSWHFLFAALVEVLFMGWDVGWHKQPTNQLVPYTVWSALIGAGVGVAIWAIWPTYQIPVGHNIAHQYLVAGIALFAYTYGVVTDPIVD